jgi:hypothetical protein
LYGYEASEIIKEQECSSGNNMLFFRDDRGHILKPTATYWGARLLSQQWVQPGNQPHEIYPAASDILNGNRDQMITAYATRRPDGLWSLLLINRDPIRTFQTSVIFRNTASGAVAKFAGTLDRYQFSSRQYALGGPPNSPFPVRSDEPDHLLIHSSTGTLSLPPYSLTVVRGALAPEWTR